MIAIYILLISTEFILGITVHVLDHFFWLFLESEDINFCFLTIEDLGSLNETWLTGFMVKFMFSN